ncbi:HD domain-containing protein [Enterococcus sp. UD-01]|jgi:HD superfamily phosphohydrolase|uniref:HD domain-containing protein n=1 Tax=Enterococcus sp. UD-01 TaxID=3373911 RepID=UPI0038358AE2
MEIYDELYGRFTVEPLLESLILSTEVQRLKQVHMAGAAVLVNPLWNETRYEHSLGVMLLIRRLGGSLEEQIAGLLHDISHTAFSHVVDLALSNEREDYHEQIKANYIQDSEIAAILEQAGYSIEALLFNDEQWPLLEQEAPLLCCDRIDYTLREVQRYFAVPLSEIQVFLDNLLVSDQRILLQSVEWANWFIDQYRKIVIDFFYDPRNIYSYEWLAQAIRQGLESEKIGSEDLLLTDSAFLAKLKQIDSPEIRQLLAKLDQAFTWQYCSSEDNYDIFQKKKLRLVDPLVKTASGAVPVSQLSTTAYEKIKQLRRDSEQGIYLIINEN